MRGADWKKPSSGEQISAIHETDTAISIFPAEIIMSSNNLKFNVLLDTGAMQGNYISEEIAEWLRVKEAQSQSCSTEVCSAFRGVNCYKSNKFYNFHLAFLSEHTSKHNRIFDISAITINTSYDVIVGVPTIRKYNLLNMLVSCYSDVNSSRKARGYGSLGQQISLSDLLPSTIAALQQINIIKHQTELPNFEPEIDDLEMYTRDVRGI